MGQSTAIWQYYPMPFSHFLYRRASGSSFRLIARTCLRIGQTVRALWRVQCKTGWIEEDGIAIKFATANQSPLSKTRGKHHYRGQCDYFAVYNEELDKVYIVPVDEVGTTQVKLRLTPTKNNQEKYVRWAKDYEL